MVLSWKGGDTGVCVCIGVGGAVSPAEDSPAKKSREGNASLRIQTMPGHNKATSSLSLRAQLGLPGSCLGTRGPQSRPTGPRSTGQRERAAQRAGGGGRCALGFRQGRLQPCVETCEHVGLSSF